MTLPELHGWLPATALARREGVAPSTIRRRAARGLLDVIPNPLGAGSLYRPKVAVTDGGQDERCLGAPNPGKRIDGKTWGPVRGTVSVGRTYGLNWTVFSRDGFRCVYCGRSAMEDGVRLHADHVVPRSAGGSNRTSNLVTSCEACNSAKGARRLDADTEARVRALAARRAEEADLPDVILQVATPVPPGESDIDRAVLGMLPGSATTVSNGLGLSTGSAHRVLLRLQDAGLAKPHKKVPSGPRGGRPSIIWCAA